MPTPTARDRLALELAAIGTGPATDTVWSWAEFWERTASAVKASPPRLSDAALRAVLRVVLGRADADSRLASIGQVARTAGFERRLAARFAAWTREGRHQNGRAPAGLDAIGATEWALFGDYRQALAVLQAEDVAGWRHALAQRLARRKRSAGFPPCRHMVVLGVGRIDPAERLALAFLAERADALDVGLILDPERPEMSPEIEEIPESFSDAGFEEVCVEDSPGRPSALKDLGRHLFQDDFPEPPLAKADGLAALIATEGEPLARTIAAHVRKQLDEGVPVGEVAIVVRQVGPFIHELTRSLRERSIPFAAPTIGSLATDPAVSALLLAMAIPIEDWDADRLGRLLRNGRLRPELAEIAEPEALAMTAAAIRETRAFRDRDRIRRALEGQAASGARENDAEARAGGRVVRARQALSVFQSIAWRLAAAARPGTWAEQVDRLASLARGLGLDLDEPALDHLFGSLEDHGDVLRGLGEDGSRTWAAFVAEAEALARDQPAPAPPEPQAAVRILTLGEAAGLSVRCVILADLGEGTFPSRDAIEPHRQQPEDFDLAFRREMALFLGLIGSAVDELVLAYPSTDAKGQELLPAGFVEDVRRRLTPEAWESCATVVTRHGDPSWPIPIEARVRAVANARLRGDTSELVELAGSPRHRDAWLGTAAALELAQARADRSVFGPFEGVLRDAEAARRIAEDFGPGRPAFSPSQLESLAFCPFQFFLRHVLRLEPNDERDELESDYASRGRRIHALLETLHEAIKSDSSSLPMIDEVAQRLPALIEREIDNSPVDASGPALGLERIEAERLRRVGSRYVEQFARYREKEKIPSSSRGFEVRFGREPKGGERLLPPLQLGGGDEAVTLQGVIDRIDEIPVGDRIYFRVIDYKTGSSPSRNDVKAGVALQLPLYALAIERHFYPDEKAEPFDVGYWAIGKKGYTVAWPMAKVKGETIVSDPVWPRFRDELERYVVALVAGLRRGEFPVAPRDEHCTKFCDYRHVCRIGQVRTLRKTWEGAPKLVVPEEEGE